VGDNYVGNMSAARTGKKMIFVLISGVYFDDPDDFAEFIRPSLDVLIRHFAIVFHDIVGLSLDHVQSEMGGEGGGVEVHIEHGFESTDFNLRIV
jgi:hypothetical protein